MRKMSFLQGRFLPAVLAGGTMLSALAPAAYAQLEKSLRFIPESVDFGTISEEDGKVSMQVKGVNISPDTTFIISARTSCGCSAAEYSESPIAPGDTTLVTVSYDPTNRPGKFLKTVRFFTGTERISNSLKLRGTVVPSRKNLDKAYPEKAGTLRLSSLLVNAGEMSANEARPLFVGLYNDSDCPMALTAETDGIALEAVLTPDTIEPFGIATLSLMLKGRLIPSVGQDFTYRCSLTDSATGDTVVAIPVGGILIQK